MNNLLIETSYFGIVLSLLTYWLAVQIRKRWSYSLLNPLLISAFLTIFVLYVLPSVAVRSKMEHTEFSSSS